MPTSDPSVKQCQGGPAPAGQVTKTFDESVNPVLQLMAAATATTRADVAALAPATEPE